jgi:hypothetical protein
MAGDMESNDGPLSTKDQTEPAEKPLAPLLTGNTEHIEGPPSKTDPDPAKKPSHQSCNASLLGL